MPNPSHVIGTPDGDLWAYDWTTGEWVSLPEAGITSISGGTL